MEKVICFLGVMLFLITEGLSLFGGLTRTNVIIAWAVVLLLCLISRRSVLCQIRKKKRAEIPLLYRKIVSGGWVETVEMIIMLLTCVVMGILAWRIVPNNGDSMTYHLARVANWIQNRSVDYYPTSVPRQLFSPVLSEYAVLHICLFMKSDITANMVQWAAYCICIYMTISICRQIGCKRCIAYMAGILFMAMPLAIAESVTTQVDLMGTMWLLIFFSVILKISKRDELTYQKDDMALLLECAVCVAMGYLTKGTVSFPMLVILIYLLPIRLKKDKLKTLAVYCTIAAAVILFFILPTFIRNYQYMGDILASDYMSGIMVGTKNPKLLILNIYKNYALLAATDWFGLKEAWIWGGNFLAGLLGVDINAPSISYISDFAANLPVSLYHDMANNPLVAYLFLLAAAVWLIALLCGKAKQNRWLNVVLIAAILVNLSVVRWQTWGSRLIFPCCALMCIFIANVFHLLSDSGSLGKIYTVSLAVVLLCVLTAVPAIRYQKKYLDEYVECQDRFAMYFATRSGVREQYEATCSYVEGLGYHKIGILLSGNSYEYPLWARLKNETTEIIQVDNETPEELPECIIAIDQCYYVGDAMEYAGADYVCIWNDEPEYAVLTRN